MKFTRPLQDYRGLALCDPCWKGHHYHKEVITGKNGKAKKGTKNIADCLGPPCECPCLELMTEKYPRVKPDRSLQMDIDMSNPIHIQKGKL